MYTKHKNQYYLMIITLCLSYQFFSKIIERLVYNRLIEFPIKNYFLNKYQFGFWNNHSTVMAFIALFENPIDVLDKGNRDIGIF